MPDLGNPHQSGPEKPSPLPSLSRRRRSGGSRPPRAAIVAVVLVAAGALIAWFALRSGGDADPSLATTPDFSDTTGAGGMATSPDVPPLELPELSASDTFVRNLVASLSSHPQLAAWLTTDALIDRFVGVVIDLAGGSTPASHVRFMAPTERFQVREANGRLVIDPAGYERFNLIAATFASLDTQGTVRLYRQLLPLIEASYAERGIADYTFDETLALAIQNVLAVQIPEGPLEVEPHEAVYTFSDPALEDRRGAAKQLIRMGPDNARLVQSKMRELAQGLGISTSP